MEQQNNNNEETTTTTTTTTIEEATDDTSANVLLPKEDVIWDGTLGDLEEWKVARDNLNTWLDEAEQGTFGQFFESKNQRTAPFSYQNLAIICHTSSGYIGDKVKKAKEAAMRTALDKKEDYNERLTLVNMILDCLAPNMAAERAKREADRAAIVAEWNGRVKSVLGSVSSILDTWREFDIPRNLASIRKIYPKYQDKDDGLYIIATLAWDTLSCEDVKTLETEMGLNADDLVDYYMGEQSINNPPASMFESV